MERDEYVIDGERGVRDAARELNDMAERIREMARSIGLDEEQISFLADARIPLAERLERFLPGGEAIAKAVEDSILKETGRTYEELTEPIRRDRNER